MRKSDHGVHWVLANKLKLLEIRDVAGEKQTDQGYPSDLFFIMLPCTRNRVQPGLSTGTGGFELASTTHQRFSATAGSVPGALLAVPLDLSGSLGERLRGYKAPGTALVYGLGEALRHMGEWGPPLCAARWVRANDLSSVLPRGWRNGAITKDC